MLPFVIPVLAGILLWPRILKDWRLGVSLLLLYLPFAGVVTLSLYPSSVPILYKDLLFVIPAYLAYFIFGKREKREKTLPTSLSLSLAFIALLTILQTMNGHVANWLVAAIGVKVWLLYLPLLFVSAAYIKDREHLTSTLRLLVVISWFPCSLGILQWALSLANGYQPTMQFFYGEAAAAATQNFTTFEFGGKLFRIPSTFTFISGYFGYTLAMLVPAFALMRLETSARWRQFSVATLVLVAVASFLCGARAAFLFVPIFLILAFLLEGRGKGVLLFLLMAPAVLFGAILLGGFEWDTLLDVMTGLLFHYSDTIVYQGFADSLAGDPWGLGTGMNTGSARYAFTEQDNFLAFESYYAKAIFEFGILGLLAISFLFIALNWTSFRAHREIRDATLRGCSAAIFAFVVTMTLNSFKGWQLDLDPINVYFWFFLGILFRLRTLSAPASEEVKFR